MKYTIYIREDEDAIGIDCDKCSIDINPNNISPKMRVWLRDVITSNEWDTHFHITSSGEHYYGWDPVHCHTFTSVDRSKRTLESRHHLSWALLNEPYVGSYWEQFLDIVNAYGSGLKQINRISWSFDQSFRGGLFSKPTWLD